VPTTDISCSFHLLHHYVSNTVCYETDYFAPHLTFLTAVNVHGH